MKTFLSLLLLLGVMLSGLSAAYAADEPIYMCPMHPQVVRHEPGKCPICGMDLVKQEPHVHTETAMPSAPPVETAPAVSVSPVTVQNMGIRTAKVTEQPMSRSVNSVGYISYNENALQHVHSRAKGWVEVLNVRSVGDRVKKGEVLLEYYSPDILDAQNEMLIAKRTAHLMSEAGQKSLFASAETKLRLLDVPEATIAKLRDSDAALRRIPILAPQDGVVTSIGFREGMYISPETELYTITNLDSVWVLVDVFDQQMDAVKVGNSAEIRTDAMPDKVWRGKVNYIYPDLVGQTRTLKARLTFDMADASLKPNMYVDVRISGATHVALAIPQEAVIPTEDGARVVKVSGSGEYTPVMVKTGLKSGDYVEVLDGLKAGDEIVVSGQFMLDSESNLQASFRRMGAQ
ncbi:MAG: efflux RND transporter periplasmic adaptor subunit [Thiothrix sp.]|uniref:efflux RND transporter periplasmic adaptor subunit n=1 Tax=Thiothrix sp. TaxID=1032 RepID=UPI00260458D2|nr:efflux RND transporter periplasmic adaptor subunit [Thiothrix sp.]MDD5395473.1 efflux RND transporter periplasmic adaptor subunit [Thiothrix sp.]